MWEREVKHNLNPKSVSMLYCKCIYVIIIHRLELVLAVLYCACTSTSTYETQCSNGLHLKRWCRFTYRLSGSDWVNTSK